ncbi:hypothetical protein BDZ89DRAFT_1163834 [Hymenopellis radicata]|nr:hypothetical protein BDZ89DRAFT_1163834 [Hymenopellis radicata]
MSAWLDDNADTFGFRQASVSVIAPGPNDNAVILEINYAQLLAKANELQAQVDLESDTEDASVSVTTRSTTRVKTRAYGAYAPSPSKERRTPPRFDNHNRQRSREQSRAIRRLVRNDSMNHGIAKVKGITRRIHKNATPIPTTFEPNLGGRKTMYTGPKDPKVDVSAGSQPSLAFLLEDLSFQLLKWNGRRPVSVLDCERRILVHLAGRPEDFDDVVAELNRVFAEAEVKLKVPANKFRHRRGAYKTVSFGASLGGGQIEPMNLKLGDDNERVVEDLMSNWAVTRLIGFVNSAFAAVHPQLHAKYNNVLNQLLKHHPKLRRCFKNSVFGACSINVGRVFTARHHDHLNLVTGMCSITAGGDFDYTQGGHLVLWDLQLVIEFPPGSTIMIPSALLEHSNLTIANGETRWSFTQYSAAGLFRWFDNGFKSDGKIFEEFKEKKQIAELAAFKERRSKLWEEGLNLIGTL